MISKRDHMYGTHTTVEANRTGNKRETRMANPRLHKVNNFKAFCVCGLEMLPTTPQDVYDGIQPRCPTCPKPKDI